MRDGCSGVAPLWMELKVAAEDETIAKLRRNIK